MILKDINGREIKVGDVIIRARHSELVKHKVVRITPNGVIVSSLAKIDSHTRRNWHNNTGSPTITVVYPTRLEDATTPINMHNSTLYINAREWRSNHGFMIVDNSDDNLDINSLKSINTLKKEYLNK